MNYKQSNYLIDVIMPAVKPTTYKVVCAIARKTWGWKNQEEVELSFSEISALTGITSANTIKTAIQEASSFIEQLPVEGGQGYKYKMRPMKEDGTMSKNDSTVSKFDTEQEETLSNFDTVPPLTVSKNDTVLYQELTELPPALKNGKEEEKEKEEDSDPLAQLEAHFTAVSGIFPKRGNYDEDWQRPLTVILNGGNLEKAKLKISRAVEFARNPGTGRGKYVVRAPSSLMTIIANLPDEIPTTGENKPSDVPVGTIMYSMGEKFITIDDKGGYKRLET